MFVSSKNGKQRLHKRAEFYTLNNPGKKIEHRLKLKIREKCPRVMSLKSEPEQRYYFRNI